MLCHKCPEKAVIELQHGALCRNHFINYFEDKVFKTIKKYQLIERKDKLCVAASGGKDSLTVLHLTKKYLEKNNLDTNNLFALVIDEGIANYRQHTIEDLKLFCQKEEVELKIISAKQEFNYTLDQAYPIINKKSKKKPCNICGVWRRYLLNKYSRKFAATKLITGHNLDDEAQAIIMNIFKANTELAAHLGPISGVQEHKLFVRRIKPLYFCTEKETRLYALLKRFQVNFKECPYAEEGYRIQIRDMLNEFESKYKGTKQGIIQSFLALLPLLKEKAIQELSAPIKVCIKCQEPANQEICNACKLGDILKNAR
mgnify:CR=1 FL=1